MKICFAIIFIAISMAAAASEDGQCPITSLPPKPKTGCCGREVSDSDRNGASKSDLEKFPWAVRLKVTFNADETAIKCGGTLISSKYVLTAGHCVYAGAEKTVMYKVEVYFAQYDKRTSPKDCKNVLDQGKKCIEDVVMKAEEVILHPEYEGKQLKNDIALLRLLGAAPYTDYIRPICLPTNDVDSLENFGLRLAVAGWGQNGQHASDIKQVAIVHIVTHKKCKKYYPGFSKLQMCTVGYEGQDVCKGDAGDPLMAMNGGKYELVGIVSGKREDSPCESSTSVPSLYVNVYHYVDWIRSNMK